MPLQNRVDPFGNIHAVAARGMFTGNRGVLHDPDTRRLSGRRWSTKAWIVCDCGYRGLKRDVMGRNAPSGGPGWTNLFFLDEPTALCAGHRPCFTCRREKAREFLDCFARAFDIARPSAPMLDERLHGERLASGGSSVALVPADLAALPDGAIVATGEAAYAMRAGRHLPWRFEGYGVPVRTPAVADVPLRLLTPATSIAILRAGYAPCWSQRPVAASSPHPTPER
ncbi:MAG: hypothetical protein KF914_19480 [Rhizobiaceae bacterium]|nr:hypothetical protein [Rhizobiaceae bacterium]